MPYDKFGVARKRLSVFDGRDAAGIIEQSSAGYRARCRRSQSRDFPNTTRRGPDAPACDRSVVMTTITNSTGYCLIDCRRWWREQSRIDGTDWPALLHQHERAFQELARIHGVSS
jgi:hypothetical protein